MKYVMFQWPSLDGRSFTHVPVIFPEMMNHSDISECVQLAWHRQMVEARKGRGTPLDDMRAHLNIRPMPVSAGFLDINCTVDMTRNSETLKMGPDPADQSRINTWRYTWGQF